MICMPVICNYISLLHFIASKFIMQIDVPTSASALQSLIEASIGSLEHGWEVGWSLASLNSGPQSLKGVTQMQVSLIPGFSGVPFMC